MSRIFFVLLYVHMYMYHIIVRDRSRALERKYLCNINDEGKKEWVVVVYDIHILK